jgi:hypothetical protein
MPGLRSKKKSLASNCHDQPQSGRDLTQANQPPKPPRQAKPRELACVQFFDSLGGNSNG